MEEKQHPNLNTYIMVAGFLLTFASSIGSYFKALADIRSENQQSLYQLAEKQRIEYSRIFASKEEATFIKELLLELKGDVREINTKLDRRSK